MKPKKEDPIKEEINFLKWRNIIETERDNSGAKERSVFFDAEFQGEKKKEDMWLKGDIL